MKADQIKEKYLSEENNFKILVAKEERQLIVLSVLRLLSFIGGFVIIWFCFMVNLLVGFLSVLRQLSCFFIC